MEIVLIVILGVFVFDCQRRIGILEKKGKQSLLSSALPTPTSIPAAAVMSEDLKTGVAPAPVFETTAPTPMPKEEISLKKNSFSHEQDAVLHFLGDDWLVKVGVLLLVLSLGWFVTYAFMHDWIGPVGRVTLGMLFGLILLVAGTWRFGRSSVQGISLLSGGVASIYVSIFSGITLYDFYTPVAGLFFMGLVTLYMAIISAVKKSQSLSVATLVSGLIAPIFVFDSVGISVLFVYLFILSAGIIVVDVFSGWRATTFSTLAGVFLYSSLSYANGDIDRSFSSFVMVSLFTFLFYGANVGMILSTRVVKKYDLWVTALVGFAFFAWVLMTVDSDFVGMVFIGAALLFAITSFAISLFFTLYEPMLLYAAVAVGFLFAATQNIFDGSLLTVLLAVEIGGLVLVSFAFFREKNFQVGRSLSVLLVWPLLLSLENVQELIVASDAVRYGEDFSGSPIKHLFVLAVMAGVSGVIALILRRLLSGSEKGGEVSLFRIMKVVSIGYVLMFSWFFLHMLIPGYYVASMVALILFTIVGLYLYTKGTLTQRTSFRNTGLALFIVVLVRLFLVEFWTMSSVEKIITFFVVGALFLSTAFLLQKKTPRPNEVNPVI